MHTPGRRYLLLSPALARFAFYKAELGCTQQESNRVGPKRNHCIYRWRSKGRKRKKLIKELVYPQARICPIQEAVMFYLLNIINYCFIYLPHQPKPDFSGPAFSWRMNSSPSHNIKPLTSNAKQSAGKEHGCYNHYRNRGPSVTPGILLWLLQWLSGVGWNRSFAGSKFIHSSLFYTHGLKQAE